MLNRQSVIPSKHSVNTFMCSFAEDPVFNLLKQDNTMVKANKIIHLVSFPLICNLISQQQETDEEKSYFAKALDKLREKEFDPIIELCTNELESEAVGK